MSFNVRLFGYRGILQIQQNMVKQHNADSVFVLDEPRVWSQLISVSAVAAVSAVQSPDLATVVMIEIPDGQLIRYEVQPNGPNASTARVAGTNSPRKGGVDFIQWGAGFTISMIDAAGLP